ncbi:glycosyltransferase family 4 protein [Pelotomaculum propionicicum]|uniref:Alpha-maltose-1-phosphate synthase n=1 Tax=Pelotomaculum propionicicum TaxID=258475 RepID=A0A4Y7RLM3_9FIRM|nr:glycosyltransferase family 4 protein [Pelotomaculum propionicicum]TEB09726.1 Alpha-maltose-1-phosphate synthase [Pelotomaculum propionicicum]
MTRIKVLLIVTLSELGGAQKVVYHIAAGLPPEQFEVTVACAPGGELVNWLRNLPRGVQVMEISGLKRNISLWDDLKAFKKLYALIKKGAFDIVHCHSSKAGVLGRLAAYFAGVPKIYFTAHGWGINEYQSRPVRFFYTWAERLAGVVSTGVVCVSESDLLKGRNLRLAANDKLKVIYNGMPEPRPKEGVLRGELNIRKEDIVIGSVARLAPQKDPLFLLEVAGRMITSPDNNQDRGRVYFVIIGDGPLRSRCEEFVNLKNLQGSVFLMGAREDAAELLRDFDVFVLFSRWEGLPLTIIEAMLAGRPVVASAVGGVSEMVVDQKTGLLINASDGRAAVQALRELAADRERRLSMGEAGRRRAVELFSINEMVNKYRELYLS